MPVTAVDPKDVSSAVTVPGYADLEFSARSSGGRSTDAVVLYAVMDGAAVRISEGASQLVGVGPRGTRIRHTLGFERTENPTPGAFRVRAQVLEDGKPQFEQHWMFQVQSTTGAKATKALSALDIDAPFVELPDDDEMTALAAKADRSAARRRAAKKGAAKKSAAKKGGATKKAGAKKAAGRKSPTKKSPTKKGATKKGAAKKGATKKAAAKKSPAKKSTAKRGAAKKAGAKKSATKKSSARRGR